MSAWGNVPLEVREMVSRVRCITSVVTDTWARLAARHQFDAEEVIKHKAADMVAHEFAGQVLREGQWRIDTNPHEVAYRVDAYCLTYDRLLALVMEAYAAGQKDGFCRAPRISTVELSPTAPITDSLAR